MLEQIKKAVEEWDALDIETRALNFRSNALHKQLDKLRMDLYNLQCKVGPTLVEYNLQCKMDVLLAGDDGKIAKLLEDIRKTTIDVRTTEERYYETRKEYSNTWPKAVKAKKKVEKLKKKFWEQEGLTL